MQLGILGGEKGGLIGGAGGLSIIQDENDSNQDSDFYGDEEDKQIKETNVKTEADKPLTSPTDENNMINPDPFELIPTQPNLTGEAQQA